jgi:hypothetical protein
MAQGYRVYFIGRDGHFADRVGYQAEDDDCAILEARARYAVSEWKAGFEIWDYGRFVYRTVPDPNSSPSISPVQAVGFSPWGLGRLWKPLSFAKWPSW